MLKFNTYRAKRYLRSKFIEGKYLLASEATDLELELLQMLRKSVQDTLGENVAFEDAWKVERLSDDEILIKPGEAWYKGLPYSFRSGEYHLVSGAILSLGTVPSGVTVSDDSTGLGKIIKFSDTATTPTNLYKIVVTAKEDLITEIQDPFLQNANLTESTAQKIRLSFQINIVPDSLQSSSPVPYRDENSTSTSVTNFPSVGEFAAPNFVNEIVISPTSGKNGELVSTTLITGAEKIDGRDVELTITNVSAGGTLPDLSTSTGNVIPKSPGEREIFTNGTLIDSNGNSYHINLILSGSTSAQDVIRIDKEPDQPNPVIINSKPYKLVRREVFVTNDSGIPQGKLHWPIATIDWHQTNKIAHSSKIVDLRNTVKSLQKFENDITQKIDIIPTGGGDVSFISNVLTWSSSFKLINPYGNAQEVTASSVAMLDGGTLVYELNLSSGGIISKGNLALTTTSTGTTVTMNPSNDLSQIRVGNVLKLGSEIVQITAINNVGKILQVSPALSTSGSCTVYLDSFAATTAPLSLNSYVLAARQGSKVWLADGALELETGETNQLGDGITTSILTFLGAGSELSSSPNYTSTNYVNVGDSLVSAVSTLDSNLKTVSNAIRWKESVTNKAALPMSGNVDGDVRLARDTRQPYSWDAANSVWKPINDLSNSAKIIGGGTISWNSTTGNLSFTADMYLEVKGLSYSDNTIQVASSPISLPSTLSAAYVIPNVVTGGAALSVSVGSLSTIPANALIIARRVSNDVIIGSSSTRLKNGQTTELYAQSSDQTLTYIGSANTATSSPSYSSSVRGTASESLTARVGTLTDAVADQQEDRSAYLRSDSLVTWTGTQLQFSSDIILEVVNTKSGTIKTATILAANSPLALADGESAWISINRSSASETVTVNKTGTTPIPSQSQTNKDVIVIARRKDALGLSYLHIPLHKQIIEPGKALRLGGSPALISETTFTQSIINNQTSPLALTDLLLSSSSERSALIDYYVSRYYTDTYSTNSDYVSSFYLNQSGTNAVVYAIEPHTNSRILIGGFFTTFNGNTRNRLVRLGFNGIEDTNFYTNLTSTGTGAGFNQYVMAVTAQSDGRILVGGGFTALNGNTRNSLVRLNSNGTEDTTFYTNLGTGFNGAVNSIAVQTDGKILVGGSFTTLNGTSRNGLIRLNSDGTQDTAFYTNLGTGFGGSVSSIAIQSDGKILAGGSFTTLNGITRNYLVRLNSDGTVDTSFYSNLGTAFNNSINIIKVQSDGNILVGGNFSTFNGSSRNRLVRLNSNGTEDTTFYTNLGTGFNGTVDSIAVQTDGKILVGGSFNTLNSITRNYLVRLNSDGTADSSFYANLGSGFNNGVYSLKLNSENKIFVGGAYSTFNSNTRNGIVKLNLDGTEGNDSSIYSYSYPNEFATDGTSYSSTYLNEIALDSNNKILACIEGDHFARINTNQIFRLNTDGSFDFNFTQKIAQNAFSNLDNFSGGNAIYVQSDGQILLSYGGNIGGNVGPRIVRLSSDGSSFDSTFNTNVGTGLGTSSSIGHINVQSDGKILLAGGFATFNGNFRNRLVRLNSNGTEDTAFYTNLTSTGTGAGFNNLVYYTKIQSDGKILVGGSFTSLNGATRNRLVRLNSDGTEDTTFYTNLGSGFSGTVSSTVYSIAVQTDGKILVGGFFTGLNGATRNYLVRLNSNGAEDTTFYTNLGSGFSGTVSGVKIQSSGNIVVYGPGLVSVNSITIPKIAIIQSNGVPIDFFSSYNYGGIGAAMGSGQAIYVSSIVKDNSNRLIVGGNFTSYDNKTKSNLLRLTSSRMDDTTFSTNFGTVNSDILSVQIQSDNKILVGGAFTTWGAVTRNYLMRINSDGTNDYGFYRNLGTAANNTVRVIKVLPNNQILVGGNFNAFNGIAVYNLVKLNSDGTLDTTFRAYYVGDVNCIAIQPDGKILVGAYSSLVRLLPNGALDTTFDNTFDVTGSINSTVAALDVLPNGKILVGGSFTTFKGVSQNYLALLNPNGTLDTSFNVGTKLKGDFPEIEGVRTVLALNNDVFLIGGIHEVYDTTYVGCLFAIKSDGTLYSNFNKLVYNPVRTLYKTSDGIFVGGDFTYIDSSFKGRLALLDYASNKALDQVGEFKASYEPYSSSWSLGHFTSMGDDAGLQFSISNSGQVSYTSTSLSGTQVESLIKYKVKKIE